MQDLLSKLPSKQEIMSLINDVLEQDFVFNDEGYIDITVASNGDDPNDWGFQLGDNSFSGQCYFYHHWAIGTIDSDTNVEELATDLLEQLEELTAYDHIED